MVHRVLGKDDTLPSSSATRSPSTPRKPRGRAKKKESSAVTKTTASGIGRSSKNVTTVVKDDNCDGGSEDSGKTAKSRGRSGKGCVQGLLEESSVKCVPSVVVEKVKQKVSPGAKDNADEVEEDEVESSEDESESSEEDESDGDTDDNVSISNLMRKQKCDLDNSTSSGVGKQLHIRCSLPLHRLSDGVVETLTNGGKSIKGTDETTPTGGNRFLCLYCDRSFATREIRTKHAERLHKSAAGRRASVRNVTSATPTDFAGCTFCNKAKTFSSFATDLTILFHHLIEKHGDRYFGCRECNIRLPTIEALQKHRESVHNILPKGVRKTPVFEDIDFEDSILANSISKLTTPKTAVAKSENGNHPGRKMITRLSKLNKKHQLLRNEEPMLSRLGVAQNRSPRTRKGSKGRTQVESRGVSDTGSSSCGRASRLRSTRATVGNGSSIGLNDSGEFSGSSSVKSSSGKEILSSNFDDDFYETVSVNVRKNLSCYLDGKIGSDPETPSVHTRFTEAVPAVPSTVVRSSYMTDNEIHEATSLSAITAFPTLLTNEQYGTECVSPNKNKRTITKNSWKWKWDFVKKYKYVNEGGKIVKKVKQQTSGLRDLSKLDMWTQLTMRTKHEVVQRSKDNENNQRIVGTDAAREEKRKVIEQLNTILDTRLLPQIVLEQNDQRLIKAEPVECIDDTADTSGSPIKSPEGEGATEEDTFATTLNLRRSSGEKHCKARDVILSGEWARPRCYVCFGCGAKFGTIKALEEHKATRHPHVYSTHYEIVGRELIEGELYKHFFIPTKALRRKTEFVRQVSSDDSGTVEDSMDSSTSCTISTKCDSFDTDSNSRMSNKSQEVTVCTKCKKECTGMMDLYRHMLDCVGDYAWLIAKRRLRHRYYGNRSRRRRAKLLRFGCLRSPKPPKTPENRAITTPRKQSPQTPRTRPSDADSIQRMLANLPAKRSSRSVHPAKPIPMRRRKLIATATTNKFTKRNTRTSILAAKSTGLILRSKNKSEGNKQISMHLQQAERITRSGKAPSNVRKIVKSKRVTRSSESPNTNHTEGDGVTTRNKTKLQTTPIKKNTKGIIQKVAKKFPKTPEVSTKKPTKDTSNPTNEVKSSKETSGSSVSKKNSKDTENHENVQKNGKSKKVKAVQKADIPKKITIPDEKEKPFLEEQKASDQEDLVEIKEIMDSIIDLASAAVDTEQKEKEKLLSALPSTPTISIETKSFETPVGQKIEDTPPLTSPTSATPGKRRTRRLTDCIARLTDKLQEKLGIPFLDNSATNILTKAQTETEKNTNPTTEVPVTQQKEQPLNDEKSKIENPVSTKDQIQPPNLNSLIAVEKSSATSDIQPIPMIKSIPNPPKDVNVAKTIPPQVKIPEIEKSSDAITVRLVEEIPDAPLNLTMRKSITSNQDETQPICLVKHPPILKIPVVPSHLGSRLHPNEIDCNVVMDLSAKSARTHSPSTSRNVENVNYPRAAEIHMKPQSLDISPQNRSAELFNHPRGVTMLSSPQSSELLNQMRCNELLSQHRNTEILKQPRPDLIIKRVSPVIQIPQVPVKSAKPKQTRKPRAKAPKVTKAPKKDPCKEIKLGGDFVQESNKSDNNNVENIPHSVHMGEYSAQKVQITPVIPIVAKSKDSITPPEIVSKSTPESTSSVTENKKLAEKTPATDKVAEKEVVHAEKSNNEGDEQSSNTEEKSGDGVGKNIETGKVTQKIVEGTSLTSKDDKIIEQKPQTKTKPQKVVKAQKLTKSEEAESEVSSKNETIESSKGNNEPTNTQPEKITKGKKSGKLTKTDMIVKTPESTDINISTKPKPKGKITKDLNVNNTKTPTKSTKKGKTEAANNEIHTDDVNEKRSRLEIVVEDILKSPSLTKKTSMSKKTSQDSTTVSKPTESANTSEAVTAVIEDTKNTAKDKKQKKKGKVSDVSNDPEAPMDIPTEIPIKKTPEADVKPLSPKPAPSKKVQSSKKKGKAANFVKNKNSSIIDTSEVSKSEEIEPNLERKEATSEAENALEGTTTSKQIEKPKKVENPEQATKIQPIKKSVQTKKKGKSANEKILETANDKVIEDIENIENIKKTKADKSVADDHEKLKESQLTNAKLKKDERKSSSVKESKSAEIPENLLETKKKGKTVPKKTAKGKNKLQVAEDQEVESEKLAEPLENNKAAKTKKTVSKTDESDNSADNQTIETEDVVTSEILAPLDKKTKEKITTKTLEDDQETKTLKEKGKLTTENKQSELNKKSENIDGEKSSTPVDKAKTVQKPRKKRKNELAAIIADQLLESFKEVDKSRIDELKILHDLSCEANANNDELLVSNAIEMVTTTKRKAAIKQTNQDTLSSAPAKKKAKEVQSDVTTPKISENELKSQYETPVEAESKKIVDVPVKPKKSSRAENSESTKSKSISKEKKDLVISNLLRKLEDKGDESSEGDSSRLSSSTSRSSSSRKKKDIAVNKNKSTPKEQSDKIDDVQIESEKEAEKISLEEVNNRMADSVNLLAAMDMNTKKNVESTRGENEKITKPLDWISRAVSMPKNVSEVDIKKTSSSAAKPKFILKPSRLQALTSSVPDPFDQLKGTAIDSEKSSTELKSPPLVENEKKNGEHSETVAKLVDKIRESNSQSDSDDDTCLAEIAKSLNNRILTTDEFTNVADTLPIAETPCESPNAMIASATQNTSIEEANAEQLDMDAEDGMSVLTSVSMDSGITTGPGKTRSQKQSTLAKKRKVRRSVLYKSKKPKATKTTADGEPVTYFCDICKKHFSRQDRLTKHKMTITHIAKLSEQEFLDSQKNRMVEEKENESQNVDVTKTPVAEEKKDVEVSEKPTEIEEPKMVLKSPIQTGVEPISSPEQAQVPSSTDQYPSPARSLNPGTPRLNLSQEEKLFYECCNMLKGSNRIGAESENKSLTPKSNEQPTNCFGGSHNAVYCVKSPMSHRRSSPKHAYPKIDINQFSDISSDSNPMFSRPNKLSQPKGIFEDTTTVNNQLSGFLATAEKFLNGAASTSNSMYYSDKVIDSTPPVSGTNPKDSSHTGRSYSDSFSDMGDSYPSSQDASESENYAQTILDRSGSNKAAESDSPALKEGSDSFEQSRKHYSDKHLSDRSPIHSTTSSQCSSISKVRTKGAMKGYDNFKVSIPTNGLDLQQALERNPHVNSKLAALADIALGTDNPVAKEIIRSSTKDDPSKPSEYPIVSEKSPETEVRDDTPTKNVKVKKAKENVGNRLGFKSKKKSINKESKDKVDKEKEKGAGVSSKNPMDVYEFEESKDSVDAPILPLSKRTFFRANLDLISSKNPESSQKPADGAAIAKNDFKKPELEDNASQISSTSFSDRDDFNYNSNISDDSDSESHSPSPKLPTTPSSVKKTKKLPDPVQKKSLIMGRIFKNAQKNRPPTENKNSTADSEAPKKPFLQKQELDKLFDSLKGDGKNEADIDANPEPQMSSTKSDSGAKTDAKDEQRSSNSMDIRRSMANRKSRELAMFEAEWGMSLEQIEEIIGIGKRKSQRKCAVGKQKILAETWSSDEYEEFQSTKDIIALIQEKELRSSQRALRNQRRRESQKNQAHKSLDDTKDDQDDELDAETWDVRRALGLEYKKARGKKAVRIAGGSDVESSQKTQNAPKLAKIKKRRQTVAYRATEPSPSPERDIPIRNTGKRRGSTSMRGTTSDGESSGRKSKKVKFPGTSKESDKSDSKWTQSRPMARSKRVASEMLYYWSSSSDDEFGRINNSRDDDDDLSQEGEVLQQHGWIVGDSHKKLVTLLAHAKGKKTEECGVKEASSGNNKKKSSS
ncbi:uncharacterized protein LOC129796923 [Lutzomyia longipalpis]|uniref:uncharacterized protein LOC129796923 n=1 Tax=Lutzomyia longipalpis TaxID=7200 RepID=UPI002484010B|nr:uncharacterized protein LOC129796923 [Lutzomyia longipalpis]